MKWIDVEKHLPLNNSNVICVDGSGSIIVGRYEDKKFYYIRKWYDDSDNRIIKPSHWMYEIDVPRPDKTLLDYIPLELSLNVSGLNKVQKEVIYRWCGRKAYTLTQIAEGLDVGSKYIKAIVDELEDKVPRLKSCVASNIKYLKSLETDND
jgi:hypothetical protein